MPRLVHRARARDVEADFDDLVVGPEHRLADPGEPRVGDELLEASQPRGRDLDVVAVRPTAKRAVRLRECLLEEQGDVLAQLARHSRL